MPRAVHGTSVSASPSTNLPFWIEVNPSTSLDGSINSDISFSGISTKGSCTIYR